MIITSTHRPPRLCPPNANIHGVVFCVVSFCCVLLDWVVQVLQQVGEIGEARSIYESVIDCRTQQLGAKHADTLMAQMNLAILHKEQGEFEKARAVRTLHCTIR